MATTVAEQEDGLPQTESGSGLTGAAPDPNQPRSNDPLQMDREAYESLRAYLMMVAREELPQNIRGRVAPSDMVQETFLYAQRLLDQGRWDGGDVRQRASWLRQILIYRISAARKRHGTKKAGIDREAKLDPVLALRDIAADNTPPMEAVIREERRQRLREAVARLPQHYRHVFEGRHLHGLTFERLAAELKTTAEAVRKLWVRALERLERDLANQS